jgi:hypothetical protein
MTAWSVPPVGIAPLEVEPDPPGGGVDEFPPQATSTIDSTAVAATTWRNLLIRPSSGVGYMVPCV